MANNNMLVKPIATKTAAQGGFRTADVSGNMGIERKAADDMGKLLYQMDEIRMKNEAIYNESRFAEIEEMTVEFQSMVRTDKKYYQDGTKLAELKKRITDKKDEYRKFAEEHGYDMRFVNAYSERMDKSYEGAEQLFYNKFTEYSRQVQADNYLLLMDKKSKNNISLAGIGDINGALGNYKDNVDNLLRGQKEGLISMAEMINSANRLKRGIIEAYANSYVDDEGGAVKLSEMANWTDEQINEALSGFNFEKDGYLSVNTAEDFESFRKNITGAISKIKQRENAEKELTLFKQDEMIQYRKENNYAIESKKYPAGIAPRQYAEEIYTASTNNYYNLAFKNRKEAWDNGRRLKLYDESNSQKTFYNDKGITGVELINKNLEEHFYYSGGETEINQMMTRDSMSLDYRDDGVKQAFGYSVTKNMSKPSSETSKLVANLYTPITREILERTGKAKLNITGTFSNFEKTFSGTSDILKGTRHNVAAPYLEQMTAAYTDPYVAKQYSNLSPFGKLEAMKYAAENGDIHYEATYKDIEQLAQDVAIVEIFNKTGGVLDEKTAKAIGKKDSAGLLISEIASTDTLNEVLNYHLQNDKEIQRAVLMQLAPIIEENSDGYSFLDMTNGRFVAVRGVKDESKFARALYRFTNDNDFIYLTGKTLPNGEPEIKKVRGKEVIPITRYGENGDEIMFEYNGTPLLLNGSTAVFKAGDL